MELADKIIEIEQLKKEADIVAGARFAPDEDMSPTTRTIAGHRRDIAMVKSATLKQVLEILNG